MYSCGAIVCYHDVCGNDEIANIGSKLFTETSHQTLIADDFCFEVTRGVSLGIGLYHLKEN